MQDEMNKSASFQKESPPVSAWGYFIRDLIYAIPIVGLIVAIITALDHDNINLRNHARSKFIFILVWFIYVFTWDKEKCVFL